MQLSIAAARIEGRSKSRILLDVCVKHGVSVKSVKHLKHVFSVNQRLFSRKMRFYTKHGVRVNQGLNLNRSSV